VGSSAGIRPADAIVVGAGPNGLAAAVTLAQAGLAVHVIEGAPTPGGGCRTQELTLPGFRHDVCSAVHPLAAASPFFQRIDLAALGATLRTPKVAFAHPLDGGRAGYVAGSVEETAGGLGADGPSYRRLLGPLVRDAPHTLPEILTPIGPTVVAASVSDSAPCASAVTWYRVSVPIVTSTFTVVLRGRPVALTA